MGSGHRDPEDGDRRKGRAGTTIPALALLGTLALSPAASARDVPFEPAVDISSSATEVARVIAADLDRDGAPEAVSATLDDITWFGTSFEPNTIVSSPAARFRDIVAADMNHDGYLDIVAAAQSGLTWRENPAPGAPPWTSHTISSDTGWWSVATADFDRDGDLDVVAAQATQDQIVWFENTAGDGTAWTPRVIPPVIDRPLSVRAADIDADGKLDIVSAAFDTRQVFWYENQGGTPPTFAQHEIDTDPAANPREVSVGDFNADGAVDVVADYAGAGNTITLFENTSGDGSLWDRRVLTAPALGDAWFTFAADMDMDGDQDMVNVFQLAVTWHENLTGNGVNWIRHTLSAAGGSSAFVTDFDGDGDPDVLTSSDLTDTIAWYENRTIHRSASFPQPLGIPDGGAFAVGDIDGDGDLDIVSGPTMTNLPIHWFENDGTPGGSADWIEHVVGASLGFSAVRSVFLADLDGDGDLDVLAALDVDNEILWHANADGEGSFDPKQVIDTLSPTPTDLVAADLDLDGDLDVVVGTRGNQNPTVSWYANDGTGSFGAQQGIATTAEAWDVLSVAVADLNGDGYDDVLSASQGDDKIVWYENDRNPGSFDWIDRPISQVGEIDCDFLGCAVFAADVDGDGDVDALSASYRDGKIAWYKNDGNQPPGFTQQVIVEDPNGLGVPGGFADKARRVFARDLDGDGDADVLSASIDGGAAWYENTNGAGAFAAVTIDSSAVAVVRAADLDGDGDEDVLVSALINNWRENRGGQFALETSDSAPATLNQSQSDDLLTVVATHRGRTGDTDLELATLELLLEEKAGDPLTSAEANALIENLFVVVDDGSGVFESGTDTVVEVVPTLSLTTGVQTVIFTDSDLDVQIVVDTPRTYFVVAELTSSAATALPNRFRIAHLTESSSTAEDRDSDIPLTLEFAPNMASTRVVAQAAGPPSLTAVVPADLSTGVEPSTNVTVFFSEAIDPATLNASTFELQDPFGLPVPATFLLSSNGLQAVLDPFFPLFPDFTYLVHVRSGIQDLTGTPLACDCLTLFTTEFTASAQTSLPSVSEQAEGLSASNAGFSVAAAGDLNGDGLQDFIAGAPGFDVDGIVGAGAALVYFGSTSTAERIQPDIIFEGFEAHERVGVAVAGDFDVDADTVPDLLIGAEQVDRTVETSPVSVGPGRAYLIRFDLADYDLSGPGPAIVSLSRVENGGGDEIDGVVFEGVTSGDRAGFAVAGGGRINDTVSGPDILIGAPGVDTAGGAQAGAVYAIFDPGSLSGTVALDRVADGGGMEVAGVVYEGASAGDRLGSAVAFPGDVSGDNLDDIAMGAPLADTSPGAGFAGVVSDAGAAYVVQGGDLTVSTVDASDIGGDPGTNPDAVDGTQILGDQAGMQLGSALAGGVAPENEGDYLLAGAPLYDNAALTDAGLVVQTSTTLPSGTLETSWFGADPATEPDAVDGLRWIGVEADGKAGSAVAGVGDVTGNGNDDIAIGAPDTNPSGLTNAGTVYVIEGVVELNTSGGQGDGTVELDFVGNEVAGVQLTGEEAGERAGSAIGGTGDLNGDGEADFVIGAPDHEETDDGLVYLVLEGELQFNDDDLDGTRDDLDCLPLSGGGEELWSAPGEVRDLTISHAAGTTTLNWQPPLELGGEPSTIRYDTIRSTDAQDFDAGVCVESSDGLDTTATDSNPVPSGMSVYYLVRAENDCPQGHGSLGENPDGLERTATLCF